MPPFKLIPPMETSVTTAHKMKRTLRSETAFSLAEVAMALGIVAFAFVAVFGLIPTGLNTFRQATGISLSQQIAGRIISEFEQTDYSTLVPDSEAKQNNTFIAYYWDPKQKFPRKYNEQGQW